MPLRILEMYQTMAWKPCFSEIFKKNHISTDRERPPAAKSLLDLLQHRATAKFFRCKRLHHYNEDDFLIKFYC